MINKKKWILIILLLISICVFGVFNLTPLNKIFIYLSLIFSTVGHGIFFLKRKVFPRNIRIWYYIGISLMIISILTAYTYYNQSFVSGFVANVDFYRVGSIVLFIYILVKYRVSFPLFFSLISKLGWILLFLMILMAITGFEFINESELTGKVIIVNVEIVSKNLINFIAIFWLAKFLQLTSYKYLLYSLLFFSANHYGEIQRFVLLVTMLIMGVGLFKYGSKKVNLKFIIPGIFTLFFIGVFLFNTSGGESILERFYEASKIFTNREDNINDISTSIRISETEFAIERFKLHPLFGNGYARASEVDKIYGEDTYFHVSDIGLFGILYVFGIIGIIVIMGQLNLLIHFLKLRLKNYYQFTFVLSLFFMMVFTLLTGSSINGFSTFFFYISLMRLTYIPIKKSQISGF